MKSSINVPTTSGCGNLVYSYSKRNLFEYIHCLPKNDNIIHIETDGLYFPELSHLEKKIKNYANDDFLVTDGTGDDKKAQSISIGDQLGNVKYEHESVGPLLARKEILL